MRKAYDIILSDYVDADIVAIDGGFERYRYECACCWEEVRLCASDSPNQAPHFRHHSGNNNIECENYLGNRSAIISSALSHRNVRDKIEFYFSNTTKLFSIGVKFNVEEILVCERNCASFEVRNATASQPIISVPIRSSRFLPDVSEFIPMQEFSWEYYVSSTNDSKQQKYEVFRKDKRDNVYPSFFKIQVGGDDDSFQAKLVRTAILYTNTHYLIIFTHQYYTLSFQEDMQISKVIKFKTMNRNFEGVIVNFINKNSEVERKLKDWGYILEANETLSLLWPPSPQADGTLLIKGNCAYIFSSFEMQAHGNVNVHSEEVFSLGDGVTGISINGQTKVYKKNIELLFDNYKELASAYDSISIRREIAKKYVVSNDGTYLFNRCGIGPIGMGKSILLTPASEIRHYTFGYLDCIVTGTSDGTSKDFLCVLRDILKYYKREQHFIWSDFESLNLSVIALEYIKFCKKTGRINSAAKRFIEEGRI